MSYIEDKYYYEDWGVDNGDNDVSIISIVNDFYKLESWHKELRPLSYWVDDGGMGYQGSSYMDCVNWIKDNQAQIKHLGRVAYSALKSMLNIGINLIKAFTPLVLPSLERLTLLNCLALVQGFFFTFSVNFLPHFT